MKAPDYLYAWLHADTALTAKLMTLCQDSVVTILEQDLKPVNWWERYVLNLDERVFRRDVLISAHQKAYWFARTIIPDLCYERHFNLFKRLEREPITALIYHNKRVKREHLEVFCINHQSAAFYWLSPSLRLNEKQLWGRLVRYSVDGTDFFFIIELFLSSLQDIT